MKIKEEIARLRNLAEETIPVKKKVFGQQRKVMQHINVFHAVNINARCPIYSNDFHVGIFECVIN